MSFKKEYEKLQRQIAPDREFIERLSEKLQKEEQIKKKKKNKTRLRALVLSASAACAAAAVTLVMILGRPRETIVHDPDILGVGAEKIDRIKGLFSPYETQSGAVSPEALCEILLDENSTVYCSEKETFDFEDKQTAEQCRELVKRIANAAETYAEPSGKTAYYMAVSEDGKIIKFSVAGDILTIKDTYFMI